MPSVSASEFLAFVSSTRQRLLALERRYVPPARATADFTGQSLSYFQVVKPILPGQTGTGRKVTYSTKITSDPGDPIEYEGWLEQSTGELEIHDSGHRTLALEGDIIVAEYRYNKWRTFTEFGITNVRTKILENVTPSGSPPTPVEAKYQILVGDTKIPQVHDNEPVFVTRMTTVPLTAGTEFLLSYDRTEQTWFVVETGGGGGTNIAIARCQQNVTHLTNTFNARIGAVITGQAGLSQEIVVHNLRVGELVPDAPPDSLPPGYPDTTENVFVLVAGQFVIVVQRDDGQWQILQSGAVYNNSALEGGGGDPGDPENPPPPPPDDPPPPPPDDPPPDDPPPDDPPPDDPPPDDPPPDDPPPDDPPPDDPPPDDPPPPPPDDPPPDEPSDPSDPSDP